MTKPAVEALPYRACVGVMLLNADGLVFVGRRRSKSPSERVAPAHAWQMPQGGIDKGETPLEAARRELEEETGATHVSLLAEAPDWLTYELPDGLPASAFGGRYRGQRLKWFAFRFEGADDEIDVLRKSGSAAPEFDAWRWEKISRLADLVVPFKRDVYLEVAHMFARFTQEAD
jgi:putative (di)nucleoside polyphosphate hydrolase